MSVGKAGVSFGASAKMSHLNALGGEQGVGLCVPSALNVSKR